MNKYKHFSPKQLNSIIFKSSLLTLLGVTQQKTYFYLINTPDIIYKIVKIKALNPIIDNGFINFYLKAIDSRKAINNPSITFFIINKYLAMIYSFCYFLIVEVLNNTSQSFFVGYYCIYKMFLIV